MTAITTKSSIKVKPVKNFPFTDGEFLFLRKESLGLTRLYYFIYT